MEYSLFKIKAKFKILLSGKSTIRKLFSLEFSIITSNIF